MGWLRKRAKAVKKGFKKLKKKFKLKKVLKIAAIIGAALVTGGAAVGAFTGSIVGGIAASNKYDGSKADKAYDRMIESKRGAIHKRVEKNVNRVKNVGRSVKKFLTIQKSL